jgi:polysaccharide pyruvyl transferase WcaK-like protein
MKILIGGFFGEGNLGDETILQAICENLPQHAHKYVTSGNHGKSQAQTIRRRGFLSWIPFLQTISQCRYAIFSGGLLQDWSFEGVTFFALRILAASAHNCRPSLWGAGIGPLRTIGGRQLAKRALKRIDTAWLRDNSSVELFSGLTGKNARLGADWSWNFPVSKVVNYRENAPVSLNLREWPDGVWKKNIITQLKHLERQIIGVSARKSDSRVIRSFVPGCAIIRPETFSEFAAACSNTSFGLAMRYHAGLAMLRAGIPVKLIAYDQKVLEMAAEANVLTLDANSLADFRQATPAFLAANSARFRLMQESFREYFQQNQ